MLVFEVVVILAIVCVQIYVFIGNKRKIHSIEELFPNADQLSVEAYVAQSEDEDTEEGVDPRWHALLEGAPFLHTGVNQEREVVAVNGDVVQVAIKAESKTYGITAQHLYGELTSNVIKFVEEGLNQLKPDTSSLSGKVTIDQIEVEKPSEVFKEIADDTNEYLWNNKGAAADFNILKDISERHSEAIDNEVQANISTPLYIGLLGTFIGVILGLSSMLLGGFGDAEPSNGVVTGEVSAMSFITDEKIQTFLVGVLIAMCGSLYGLGFTLYGNNLLKDARRTRDKQKNSYYTFLQKELLPKLNSDMAASLGNLKSVLDSFNQDFLEKVSNFKPIVESLTENIGIQKDFILKLDEIGFTKMANANVKVFDKIKESEYLFQNFLKYQVALNNTLQKGTDLTETIESVLSKLTSLQRGFDLVPEYLQKHDESIQRQVTFFSRHEEDLDEIGARVEQYFDGATRKLTDMMQARLEHHQRDADNAYGLWSEHFNKLNNDNIYQRILDYMQPFEELNQQQDKLNLSQQQLSEDIKRTNDRLLRKLEVDAEIQKSLLKQLTALNENLTKPGPIQVVLGKVFGRGVNGVKVNGKH